MSPFLAKELISTNPSTPSAAPGILVLDEDEEVYDMVQSGVRRRISPPCPICWRSDIDDAWESLEQNGTGILICDVWLAGRTLKHFIKEVKEFYPHLFILVATTYRHNRILVDLIHHNQIDRFFSKPLIYNKLMTTLDAAVRNQRQTPWYITPLSEEVRETRHEVLDTRYEVMP